MLPSADLSIAQIFCTDDAHLRPIKTDIDVAALTEFAEVRFSTAKASSCRATEAQAPPMTREEYLTAHWVNESAGFYALCGKMSAEEEQARLLEIVAAFSVPADGGPTITQPVTAGGERPTVAMAEDLSLTVVPGELVSPLWGDVARGSTAPPLVLQEAELIEAAGACLRSKNLVEAQELSAHHDVAQQLASQLAARGFAVVELSAHTADCNAKLLAAAAEFFETAPVTEKASCIDPSSPLVGYQHRPSFEKELYQVR